MSEPGSSNSDENKQESEIIVEVFKDLCNNNATYFATDSTENGQRLYISFMAMKEQIDLTLPVLQYLETRVANYDFDENTPGNGYRSFVQIFYSAINYGIHINKKVCLKRDGVLFRKSTFAKELEACAQLFASLHSCLNHLKNLMQYCPDNELFATKHQSPHELVAQTEDINQYCFYGRPLGFQFVESIRGPLRFITLSMAIFSEAYYSDGSIFSKATNSFMTTTKFVSDPEQRAKRIVHIAKYADVHFCKAFWYLSESELMQYVPSIVSPNLGVCKVINIPTEPMTIEAKGRDIEVPIPLSHMERKAVHVRLISYETRQGMIGEARNTKTSPASRGLLIHCHGGGFVAQSSKAHEVYLRQWAKDLRIPILSIDYSLAPLAPYPRALEEILYAYCWVLKNYSLLGSTGERIVAAGDSAGANLLTAMTLKCHQLGIPKPHGLFLAYAPLFVNLAPSPARLLSKMDPLLPFGFLTACIKAYITPIDTSKQNSAENRAVSPETESFEEISESDLLELQAHKSPTSEMSDTLTYGSLTSQTDQDEQTDVNKSDADASQKFDMLDKFVLVLDSDTDTDGTKIAVLRKEEDTSSSLNSEQNIERSLQGRVTNFVSKMRGKMSNLVSSSSSGTSGATAYLEARSREKTDEDYKFDVPTDPFISPLQASDNDLKGLPPVKIITVQLDPCLDDCVSFAKKLKNLNHNVTLDILDGLPHGFLNFSLICKEAYDASKLCTQRISELLDLDNLPPLDT